MRHKNVTRAIQGVATGQPVAPVRQDILKTNVPVDFARNSAVFRCRQYVFNNGASHEPTYAEMTDSIPVSDVQDYAIQAASGRFVDPYHEQYQQKMYSIRLFVDQPASVPLHILWPGQLVIISDDGTTQTEEYSAGTAANEMEGISIDLDTAKYYDLHVLTYTGTAGYRFEMAIDLASITTCVTPLGTVAAAGGGIPRGEPFTWLFKLVDETDLWTPETGMTPTVTISKDGAAFTALTGSPSVTEVGSGWYKVVVAGTDMDYSVVVLKAIATGCAQADQAIYTS